MAAAETTHRRSSAGILKSMVVEVILMAGGKPLDPLTFCAAFDESEYRRELIAQAAYFRAKHRQFAAGRECEDWLAAEAEVDRLLAGTAAAPRIDHRGQR